MQSEEIRKRFLEFFKNRGHSIIPSASLVPENDPSVLFNTAGMQPLVPYLLGEPHPAGKRIVNVQKCVRTQDIDEVGDNTHDTFFEMLGNWSLGDYFKEESIKWSYELLTSKEEGMGLDPNRLYITCFEGDENASKDTESAEIWKKVGIPEHRIYFLGADKNWWSAGDSGPCGPDTEIFYDITPEGLGDLSFEKYKKADDEQKIVEIWNNVFMEYNKQGGKVVGKLPQKNVDTGAGLERWVMVLQKKDNIFDTDLFAPIMQKIGEYTKSSDIRAKRIVADHVRTAVFMIADGVVPSNTDKGYILRRLLRRAKYYYSSLGARDKALAELAYHIIPVYKNCGYGLDEKLPEIDRVITEEETAFYSHLLSGKKIIEKTIQEKGHIPAEDAFLFKSTYGYPIELISEIVKENKSSVDLEGYLEKEKKHKEISKQGSEQKFKGGLADTGEVSVRYHTATHLLHKALREVLGEHVMQKGSNITPERLRFDFTHTQKMTDEEKIKVENIVNEKIKEALPVNFVILPKEEAEKTGALHFFGEKYGDQVKVYYVGESLDKAYSKEFCGGPHVSNTSELGVFKIVKEEAVATGVRRIKAILE
jgi:alanyl-tRNA synthetase